MDEMTRILIHLGKIIRIRGKRTIGKIGEIGEFLLRFPRIPYIVTLP
jgi:hypothetical protein